MHSFKGGELCHEYIFLKATSSELFMRILARTFIVAKLLAIFTNVTQGFQVIYVIVFSLERIYQLLKFLVKEDAHGLWAYRVLSFFFFSLLQMNHLPVLRTGELPCVFLASVCRVSCF